MEIPVVLLVAAVVVAELAGVDSWSHDWTPNSVVKIQVTDRSTEIFEGRSDKSDHFRLLMADETSMLLGARNAVHNVSLAHLEEDSRIDWEPQTSVIELCTKKQKSKEQCQNYIRVIVKKKNDKLYICGTNAFRPRCREYKYEGISGYRQLREENGVGKSPFDTEQNSTSVYADGNLYSATVADFNARDPLIIDNNMVRTEQYDSKWLNEPNFVSSFEKDDKIMFFFRETAVEHTNCGKAVFSRVARVCKRDQGGAMMRQDKIWTSFFKARLNCSIPGDFPFYFDEIQSTSEFGEGNFRPVSSSSRRSDMVYAVFNTPQNSIRGSAVCAFSYADIAKTFEGRFKGQESAWHNWLAVPKERYPVPHPQKCVNRSMPLEDTDFNFIKTHPLMDSSVPALGGTPLLIQTSFAYRFTQIAIDWQIHGVDKYYDIMFIGTDNGRVIKAVNTQENAKAPVKTVVIEDIQVLKPDEAVVNLKVYRHEGMEKLIVISNDNVVSIPLHRCNQQRTCSGCVALQDPYCAWQEDRCSNADRGAQSIETGKSSTCKDKIIEELTSTTTQAAMTEKCVCPTATGTPKSTSEEPGITDNGGIKPPPTRRPPLSRPTWDYEEADYGKSQEQLTSVATAETLAIAVVVSIVLSMLVGFLIGYKVSACRASRDIDPPYQERNIHLSKRSNRLSSGDHTYFNPDSPYKNFSYVVNVKTPGKLNTSVETKPVTKSNKVYL